MLDLNVGVNNKEQLSILNKYNVKKIFCGYIDTTATSKWNEDFALLNRRGKGASICGRESFKEFATEAKKQEIDVYVTFNILYTLEQYDWVLKSIDYVSSFEAVKGIIVGDIGLLLRLKNLNYKKEIVISTSGTTFNSSTVSFFKQFGISRVVLDRQLKVDEIISILEQHKDMNFEIFLLFSNCTFIDGYCSLLHQLNNNKMHGPVNCGHINYLRSCGEYKIIKAKKTAKEHNIKFLENDDSPFRGCNFCAVKKLSKYCDRITYKVVTRDNYVGEFEKTVKHLNIIQNLDTNNFDTKELFRLIFDSQCNEKFGCYISPLIA